MQLPFVWGTESSPKDDAPPIPEQAWTDGKFLTVTRVNLLREKTHWIVKLLGLNIKFQLNILLISSGQMVPDF